MLLRFILISLLAMAFVSETFGATTKSPAKSTTKSTKKSTTKSTNKSTAKSKNAKTNVKTTTAKPITCNCTAAFEAIGDCFENDGQEKSSALYEYYTSIYDMKSALNLLKKLKNNGCIKASAWPDIQAYVELNTPPEPLANIYNALTTDQKDTLKKCTNDPDNMNLRKECDTIKESLDKKEQKLPKADAKIVDDWHSSFWKVCMGVDYTLTVYRTVEYGD